MYCWEKRPATTEVQSCSSRTNAHVEFDYNPKETHLIKGFGITRNFN